MKKEKQSNITNNINLNGIVILVAILFFIVIIARVSYLSLAKEVDGVNLQDFASKRTTRTDTLYAKRGTIYDVKGDVLAQNVSSYTVIAYLSPTRTTVATNPKHVVDKEYTAKCLSEILGIEYNTVLSYLSKTNVYQTELGAKSRGISELTKEKIAKLNLPGIDFIETQKRNYPYGRFLSYTLGYAKVHKTENEDGTVEDRIVGELGVEAKYNKELSGTDGYNFYQKDRKGYKIPGTEEITVQAIDGNDIYLTIDSSIQLFVEQAINKAMEKYKADWVTIMMADSKTGAILASSTYPSFDPNLRDITNYLDTNVSLAFEPGSTMKIFSYMAAMEEGKYNGNETYKSGVFVTSDGTEIGDWKRTGWGTISFDRGFAMSSNVAVINLIRRHMNRDILMNYYKKLGFGSKTGVELANEVSGKVNFKYETEIYNAGFGQGITTTPIQNIKALTSISNDGVLLQPYIIDKIVNQDTGEVIYKGEKKELGTVAKESTVKKIKDLMESVITGRNGGSTGAYYYMDGYDIIAKTGTAQVPKTSGKGYYSDQIIRGFAGMFPKNNPRVIIYMAAKNPNSTDLMKNVIQEVIKNTSNYLNIFNGTKVETTKVNSIVLDSYINKKVSDVEKELKSKKIKVLKLGDGDKVIKQYPEKGSTVNEIDTVFLVTNSGTDKMINLIGFSKSKVIILEKLLNWNVEYSGTGFVKSQSIEPNTVLKKEDVLKLTFK